jgi:hypothetical protein
VSLTEIASDSTNAPEDAAQARLQLSAQSIVLRVMATITPIVVARPRFRIDHRPTRAHGAMDVRGAPHRVPADRGRQYRSSFAPDRP